MASSGVWTFLLSAILNTLKRETKVLHFAYIFCFMELEENLSPEGMLWCVPLSLVMLLVSCSLSLQHNSSVSVTWILLSLAVCGVFLVMVTGDEITHPTKSSLFREHDLGFSCRANAALGSVVLAVLQGLRTLGLTLCLCSVLVSLSAFTPHN